MRRSFNSRLNSRRKLLSARQTPTANPGDMATNQRSLLQALKANKAAPAVQGTQPGRRAATLAQRQAALLEKRNNMRNKAATRKTSAEFVKAQNKAMEISANNAKIASMRNPTSANLANVQQALKAPAGAANQGVRQMNAQQAQAMKMANTKGPVQQALKAPAGAANQGVRQMNAQQAQQIKTSATNSTKTGMAKGGMVKSKTKKMAKAATNKKGMK